MRLVSSHYWVQNPTGRNTVLAVCTEDPDVPVQSLQALGLDVFRRVEELVDLLAPPLSDGSVVQHLSHGDGFMTPALLDLMRRVASRLQGQSSGSRLSSLGRPHHSRFNGP